MTHRASPSVSSAPPDTYLWLLERIRYFLKPLEFWVNELRSPIRLPIGQTLNAWRNGFSRAGSVVCRLGETDPSLYISPYRQQVASSRINGHFDHLINNKLVFPLLMRSAGIQAPPIFATRRAGDWFAENGVMIAQPVAWVKDLLLREQALVFKPVKGLKGKGLVFLGGGAEPTMNGQPASASALDDLLAGPADAIVTGFVSQAAYASRLYPFTSNSIRVLTLWDYDKGYPFVAAAAQRIGSARSRPVDNWRAGMGGLSAEIDLETGKLGAGVTIHNGTLTWFTSHPETGAQIQGTCVDHWIELKTRICEAAAKLFFARIIGWDVLVTDKGFAVLETNGPPGLAVHQVHRPLLADPRARRFYEKHRVIPRGEKGRPNAIHEFRELH